jgi:hypothetical protein
MPPGATFKVPRLYKAAVKVACTVKEQNGNLEQLVQLYDKKTNTKAVAALVSRTLNNEGLLDKIIKSCGFPINDATSDPWLFRILIAELLLGKQRLPVGSKPVQTVLAYGPTLRTELLKATGRFRNKRNKSKSQPYVKEEDSCFEQELPSTHNQTSSFGRRGGMKSELNKVKLSESKGKAVQGCAKLKEHVIMKLKSKQTKQHKMKGKKSDGSSVQLPIEEKISSSTSKKRKHACMSERIKDTKPNLNDVVLCKSRWKAMQDDSMKSYNSEYVESASQHIDQLKNEKQKKNFRGSKQLQDKKISIGKSKKRKYNTWTVEVTDPERTQS